MSYFLKNKILFVKSFIVLILLSTSIISLGANKTFTGPGNFSNAALWGGTLPVAGDNLRINGTCIVDAAASNLVYGMLQVGRTAVGTLSWTAASSTKTLNVSTVTSGFAGSSINMTNGGILQIRTSWTTTNQTFTPGTGTILWNNTAAASTLPATITTYNNLILTVTGRVATLGVSTKINNALNITSGTLSMGAFSFTCAGTTSVSGTFSDGTLGVTTNSLSNVVINAGGIINNTVNQVYTIGGNLTMLGGSTSGTGVPIYNVSGDFLVSSGTNTLTNVTMSVTGTTSVSAVLKCTSATGTKTLNDLMITSAGTFSCTAAVPWTIKGNLQMNGIVNPNSGVYTLSGASKTISGSTAVKFGRITCSGNYTNNAAITMTTNLSITGTWSQGTTGILSLSVTPANFTVGTFNASTVGNTVNYSRAGVQNIRVPSDGSYGNLTSSGSGVKTQLGNIVANGNVTIGTGTTLDVSATNYSLSLAGNWANSGTFTPRTGTVLFTGTGAQTILKTGGETFNNISFSNAGAKTLLSAITCKNFLINTGSNLDVTTSNFQVSVKGNFTNNGALTTRNGTIQFNGAAAQTIGGTSITDFYDLTLNNITGAGLSSAENLINTLTITTGTLSTNAKAFTMISTASNTARVAAMTATGGVAGNVIVQRYAPGGTTGWALLGTPISSALTLQDWDDNIFISCASCPDGSAGGSVSIYSYNEAAVGSYTAAASYVPMVAITDPIVPNKGYWVYLGNTAGTTSAITLDVAGTLRQQTQAIPLTKTNTGSTADDGWNLIHNPFPSPISWNSIYAAGTNSVNLDNAIYVFNADLNVGTGGYATYVNGVSSPAVGSGGIGSTIPMCQGFNVHATANKTLNILEAHKIGGNPTFLKTNSSAGIASASTPLIRLNLTGIYNLNDEVVIYSQPGATSNFDSEYDALKIAGKATVYAKMSLDNGINEFQINGIDVSTSNFSMPLKTTTSYSGTYTISLANFNSFPMGACFTLFDKYTNITTDLKNSSYIFNLSDTTKLPRFILNMTMNPLNITSNITQPSCVTPSIGEISATGTNSGPWNYSWKDGSGTVIKTSLNKATADTIHNLTGGNYSLDINTVGQCDNNSTPFIINIVSTPIAQFTGTDTTYLSNLGLATFTNSSINSVSNSWDFGDMIGTSSATDPTYNYGSAGIYTVSLITQSSGGCLDTITQTVVVINNATDIQASKNTLGLILKTQINNEFLISGNYTDGDQVQVSVNDVQGKNVYDFGFINSQNIQLPIDLSSAKAGVYYVVITGNKTKVVFKLPVK